MIFGEPKPRPPTLLSFRLPSSRADGVNHPVLVFLGQAAGAGKANSALEQIRGTYEWCIIDCPPSVGLLTFNALRACDEVIVPVETGFFSLHGLAKMMDTLEMLKDRCNKDILIRVLPTLYDTRTKLARFGSPCSSSQSAATSRGVSSSGAAHTARIRAVHSR